MIIIFYLCLALAIFSPLLLSRGVLIGGDWGMPSTFKQIDSYFNNLMYTWSDQGNLLGFPQLFNNNIFSKLYFKLLSLFKINPEFYPKLLLIIIFVIASYGLYNLLRFMNTSKFVSIIGGVLLVTTPFFFNYSLMGWVYVLLSIGLLSFFIKQILLFQKDGQLRHLYIASLIFTVAMQQSQSIIWYPLTLLVLFPLIVKERRSLWVYLFSVFTTLSLFMATMAYLWLPMLQGRSNLNTGLGSSVVSLGTWAHLSLENILRGWGSLYNYQFELSYPGILYPLSFLEIISALIFFSFSQKKSEVVFLLPIMLLALIFILGPNQIIKLPFSDLYRDVSRFTAIAHYFLILGLCRYISSCLEAKKTGSKILLMLIFVILAIASRYPYLAQSLYKQRVIGADFRMRTYNFPLDYIEVENLLANKPHTYKALYLPHSSVLSITGSIEYGGSYLEQADIFATYSPVSGLLPANDRTNSDTNNIAGELDSAISMGNSLQFINVTKKIGVRYLVYRKDADLPDADKFNIILDQLLTSGHISSIYNGQRVELLEFNDPGTLFEFISSTNQVELTFSALSPVKYQLKIIGPNTQGVLNFKQSFDSGWQIVPVNNETIFNRSSFIPTFKKSIDIEHFKTDGYANGWNLDLKSLCSSSNLCRSDGDNKNIVNLIVEYKPQQYLVKGLFIGFFAQIFILIISFKLWSKHVQS